MRASTLSSPFVLLTFAADVCMLARNGKDVDYHGIRADGRQSPREESHEGTTECGLSESGAREVG